MSKTTMRVVKKLVGKKSLSQALSLTAALAASTVFGESGTWVVREGIGTGGTNWATWEDTANWEGGVLPSDQEELGINPKKSYNFPITRFVLLYSAVLAAYRISSVR